MRAADARPQLSRRLPWGHGLHVAQLSFRFPCGHRFITSRSPLYHRRPRARGRVWPRRRRFRRSTRSIRQRGKNSPGRVLLTFCLITGRKLPSVCRRPPKWRFKIRVIKDWSTVRVEKNLFVAFSERRAPGRHKRDARRNARRVRDRKSLASARHTRGSVTHRRERPSSGARRSSENRSAPESGRRCTRHRPARAGYESPRRTCVARQGTRGELRGCAEAAFRAMRGSSERAMRDCSLVVGYPHGASRLFARTRSDDVPRCDFRATRQDVGRVVVSRVAESRARTRSSRRRPRRGPGPSFATPNASEPSRCGFASRRVATDASTDHLLSPPSSFRNARTRAGCRQSARRRLREVHVRAQEQGREPSHALRGGPRAPRLEEGASGGRADDHEDRGRAVHGRDGSRRSEMRAIERVGSIVGRRVW